MNRQIKMDHAPMLLVENQWETMNVLGAKENEIVYRAENIVDHTVCAMKTNITQDFTTMRNENVVFDGLDDAGNPRGFPTRIFSYSNARNQNQRFLGLQLLGQSLHDLHLRCKNRRMPIRSVLRFGRQAIRRLQDVHRIGFVHGDVNPSNFLMGHPDSDDARTVHLTGFGASDQYMTTVDGRPKHIRFSRRVDTQTLVFGSIMGTRSYSLSRRDDLESLIYTMVFLSGGNLPWQNLTNRHSPDVVKRVWQLKQNVSEQQLFANVPLQLTVLFRYVRSLRLSEDPDYDQMYNLLHTALRESEATDSEINIE